MRPALGFHRVRFQPAAVSGEPAQAFGGENRASHFVHKAVCLQLAVSGPRSAAPIGPPREGVPLSGPSAALETLGTEGPLPVTKLWDALIRTCVIQTRMPTEHKYRSPPSTHCAVFSARIQERTHFRKEDFPLRNATSSQC